MLPFIITILSGLSFFIGYLITKFIKDEKKLTIFSVGFSFVIIIGLILFDLLPECIESIQNKWLILLYILIGIIGLKSLDLFVPDHHHSNKKNHMEHIGIISFIALFLTKSLSKKAVHFSKRLVHSELFFFSSQDR